MSLYLQLFSRFVLIITFLLSSSGKARDFQGYEQVLKNFQLIPYALVRLVALLVLVSEILVVLFLLIGGVWLQVGFFLAFLIMLIFSIAMVFVLARRIETSCNCFGTSGKIVSQLNLWRNAGFIICGMAGLASSSEPVTNLTIIELGLTTLVSILFVVIWVNLEEVITLLRS